MRTVKIPTCGKLEYFAETNSTHVWFPFQYKTIFENWCAENNFGWESDSEPNINKSDCHIFWKDGDSINVKFEQ